MPNNTPASPNRVTLACGCPYLIPAFRRKETVLQPGQEIYCWRCMSTTHRLLEPSGMWRWQCITNNRCGGKYRETGLSETLCVQLASAHSRKYSQHEIWLIKPDGVVAERWYPNGDPLFEAPF